MVQKTGAGHSYAVPQGRSTGICDRTYKAFWQEMLQVADEALAHPGGSRLVNLEQLRLHLLSGPAKAGFCLYNCRLSRYVALSPEGDLYPCDRFSDRTELRLGRYDDELDLGRMLRSSNVVRRLLDLRQRHRYPIAACDDCDWKALCCKQCTSVLYRHGGASVERLNCETYCGLMERLVQSMLLTADRYFHTVQEGASREH